MSYNNPSAGLYEASYKIPSRFKTDTTFVVGAKVEQTDDNNEDSWDDTDYLSFKLNKDFRNTETSDRIYY